jgi:hypothetical protein
MIQVNLRELFDTRMDVGPVSALATLVDPAFTRIGAFSREFSFISRYRRGLSATCRGLRTNFPLDGDGEEFEPGSAF